MRRLGFLLGLIMAAPLAARSDEIPEGSEVTQQEALAQAAFKSWLSAFRPKALAANVPAAVWDREMRQLEFLPDVLRRDRNQDEFTRTIWDYLDIAVSDERVTSGRAAAQRHGALLAQIEAQYGVPKEIVVAVWGLETSYGSWRGQTDTLSALASLAFDGRREAFFSEQLILALQILATGEVTRGAMRGSWAGAMGHTQFMPSSWFSDAVDFDQDGKRDLWSDAPADALASAANYLARHGWTKGQPWGLEVMLPAGFDYDLTSERVVKPASDWRALGVVPAKGGSLPAGEAVSILVPAGAKGAAFAIWPNFRAIEAYNPADAYVIAIGLLADRIAGGEALKAEWPRQWRALTLDERKALQHSLTAAGYDTGGIDGRIGPKTVAAVKLWQKAHGLVADGYASPDVLAALSPEHPAP